MIVREAGWLMAGRAFQIGANFVAMLVVARALGPDLLGRLSLAVTLATFAASIGLLGLEQVASRELGRENAADIRPPSIAALLGLRLAGALLASLLIVVMPALPMPDHQGLAPLLFVLVALPLAQLGDFAEWHLVARQKSRNVAAASISTAVVFASVRICLATLQADLRLFALAVVFEALLRSALLIRGSLRLGAPHVQLTPDAWRHVSTHLRQGLPLLASGIAVFAYMRLDQLMLGFIMDPGAVGLFVAATSISEAQLILSMALARSTLPALVRAYEKSPAELSRRLKNVSSAAFYIVLASALIIAFSATWLLSSFFGADFAGARNALAIHAFTAPLATIGLLSSSWFIIHGNTKHAFFRTLLGAVVNVVLNLMLIPRLGVAGAALATLAAQLCAAILYDVIPAETRPLFRLKLDAIFGPWVIAAQFGFWMIKAPFRNGT